MDKQKIWTEYHQVNWDDTSLRNTLNLTGLNILLQRAAVEHAEHLGFGYQEMSKNNHSWVLIRINIEVKRLPSWREKIKLVTWPREMSKLSAYREFRMSSSETGEVLCNASSEWFLIDLTSRRPQRMEMMQPFAKHLTNEYAISSPAMRLNKNQAFKTLFSTTPRYSSLDMNGHTNARRYFDWLDDAIYEVHGSKEISFVHMSYFHECKYGEEVFIQVGEEDSGTIRGMKPIGDQMAFLAKVEFR